MRILILSHFYDAHHGGPQILAREMGKRLAENGDKVSWVATASVPGSQEPGIRYVPVSGWNPLEKRFGIPYPIWGPKALWTLRREIADAEVVHIHDVLFTGSLAGIFFAKLLKRPVVLTQHVSLIPYPNPIFRWAMEMGMRWLGYTGLEKTSVVVFESDFVLDHFTRRKVQFRHSETIRNGVDSTRFHQVTSAIKEKYRAELSFKSHSPLILFVGRFIWKKGMHHIEKLARTFPNCQFCLVGYGPVNPAHWKLSNVTVVSGHPHTELAKYYQASDLLLSPGVGEGIPLVVQEAMACGLPCMVSPEVAFAMAGLSENCYWSHGANNEPPDYVPLLKRFLEERRLWPDRSKEARQFAKHHWDWNNCIQAYRNVFMRAVTGK